jgi:chorismate mutase
VLPRVVHSQEDKGEHCENYGSTALCDVECLQLLSRRIHFGKFVAEAKFKKNEDKFRRLILDQDREGLEAEITDRDVEKRVLRRLREKALAYGRDYEGQGKKSAVAEKVNVDAVVEIYREVVIPLTKEVEIDYLLARILE